MDRNEIKQRFALSIPDVVQATGIGRNTIYDQINLGRLKARKVGTRTVIRVEDLQAWLDALPEREAAAAD